MRQYFICSCLFCFVIVSCNDSKTADPSPATSQPAVLQKGGAIEAPLPTCEIEQIESCEVESVEKAETVYVCSHCGHELPCPNCKDNACDHCEKASCRCRVEAR